MSPEQAELSASDIDTRTDIYSLGRAALRVADGQTPFDGEEMMKGGLDAMRRIIREKEPVKPSTRLTQELLVARVSRRDATREDASADSPRRLQLKEQIALLRGDLDWIILKALEKDRTRRYDTANGLAMDIHRHLDCEPVLARPPSRLYEFQKTVRRHKFGFAAVAAVMVALAVGITLTTTAGGAGDPGRGTGSTAPHANPRRSPSSSRGVFRSPDPAHDGRTITVVETLDQAEQKPGPRPHHPARAAGEACS